MLIDNVELTMSHVGLGDLSEYALMTLFGNAHSHQLVKGLGINPSQIIDQDGNPLYPAYFRTYLKVSPQRLLNSFKLWDNVDVAVDVSKYGAMILSSKYVIGKNGEVPEDVEEWNNSNMPYMEGCNLITIDIAGSESAKRKVSAPKAGYMADLKKDKAVSKYIKLNNIIKENGFGIEVNEKLSNQEPFELEIQPDEEAAYGHAMIFSNYVKIMDWAERKLLIEKLKPGLQYDLLSDLYVLEREIYYYSNCFAGNVLDVYVKGNIKTCPNNYHGDSLKNISVFILELEMEIYQKDKNILLGIGRVKKLCNIPTTKQECLPTLKKLVRELNN